VIIENRFFFERPTGWDNIIRFAGAILTQPSVALACIVADA
jgi:hypothetical protein